MVGECGTYGEEKKYVHGFCGKKMKERNHLENLDVDGRIIIKEMLKESVRRARTEKSLAEDRDNWQAAVTHTVRTFAFYKM